MIRVNVRLTSIPANADERLHLLMRALYVLLLCLLGAAIVAFATSSSGAVRIVMVPALLFFTFVIVRTQQANRHLT